MKAAGITHLTPVQERTLRAVIVSGRDVLVQAPTGSGKTLAYLLPLAHALAAEDASGPGDATPHAPGLPSAIVFLPTRELAAQVFAHAEAHVSAAGFPCVLCVGGAPEAPQLAAIASGRGRVVVGTPGRVKEFFDRGAIRTDALIFQVLDEADRLLDGGFEQDVEAVMRPPGGRCRTMCLSATMPPRLARFLQRRLPPDHAEVSLHGRGGGNVGGAVEHLALTCHPDDTVGTILAAVDAYAPEGGAGAEEGGEAGGRARGDGPVAAARGQAIVFVETKAAAERLAGTLAIAYEVRSSHVRRPFARRFDSRLGLRVSLLFFLSFSARGRLRLRRIRLRRRRSMIPHTHRPDHNMWANEIDYNSMRPRRFWRADRRATLGRLGSPRGAFRVMRIRYLHSLRMTMITTTHRHFYVTERGRARRGDSIHPAHTRPDPPRPVRSLRTRSAPSGDDHLFFTC